MGAVVLAVWWSRVARFLSYIVSLKTARRSPATVEALTTTWEAAEKDTAAAAAADASMAAEAAAAGVVSRAGLTAFFGAIFAGGEEAAQEHLFRSQEAFSK